MALRLFLFLHRRSLGSSRNLLRDQPKQNDVSAERPNSEKSLGHTLTPPSPGEHSLIGF